MSTIIKRKINNSTYLIEVTTVYLGNGKHKTIQKSLGRVDENGELIASKKKSAQSTEGRSGGNSPEDDREKVHNKAEKKSHKNTNYQS